MVISAYLRPPIEGASKRQSARRQLQLEVRGTDASDAVIDVKIHNISLSGMLIECSAEMTVDDQFDVHLPQAGTVVTRVIWSSESLYGCQFETPISPAALSAAQLQSTTVGGAAVDGRTEAPPAVERSVRDGVADPRFGPNLKRLRIKKKLSQADIALALGVSAPSVSGWENGRARPKHDRMGILADLLGVPVSQLLVDISTEPSQEMISAGRDLIARANGVDADRVRIFIEV
ncbi:Transcriptional regulator, contains XRE-family HTH domain [Sphingopyxis sp. YR583]|uniref:helix-turn-helix domain-containing protein n=1 Tax=Sphingopyxis sp. YR583 TaxID=1881047 RepID=UPI0008A7E5FB|nr:helix-turn-helix domain-containing protein [Sphingopyxis sp. YR583]SEH18230.1 Transcriptional regulator, contains XRE-family HTH domain [Sphingopyxis sp. YR583]